MTCTCVSWTAARQLCSRPSNLANASDILSGLASLLPICLNGKPDLRITLVDLQDKSSDRCPVAAQGCAGAAEQCQQRWAMSMHVSTDGRDCVATLRNSSSCSAASFSPTLCLMSLWTRRACSSWYSLHRMQGIVTLSSGPICIT